MLTAMPEGLIEPESPPEHSLSIPASPDQVQGGFQGNALDTGLRRYDEVDFLRTRWTFLRQGGPS